MKFRFTVTDGSNMCKLMSATTIIISIHTNQCPCLYIYKVFK